MNDQREPDEVGRPGHDSTRWLLRIIDLLTLILIASALAAFVYAQF